MARNSKEGDSDVKFSSIKLENTQTCRNAIHTESVFDKKSSTASVINVKINREWPIYEVFINHGTKDDIDVP